MVLWRAENTSRSSHIGTHYHLWAPQFSGFDAPHMRARIVPLPKKQQVDTADQTRPITVMPALYRVWSAVVAHQIIKDAHTILPEGIVGFVKGRSGLHAMHKLAWHIEKTRFRQQHASGLTLDLTKAFNQFPRVPVMMILQAMGYPQNIWSIGDIA